MLLSLNYLCNIELKKLHFWLSLLSPAVSFKLLQLSTFSSLLLYRFQFDSENNENFKLITFSCFELASHSLLFLSIFQENKIHSHSSAPPLCCYGKSMTLFYFIGQFYFSIFHSLSPSQSSLPCSTIIKSQYDMTLLHYAQATHTRFLSFSLFYRTKRLEHIKKRFSPFFLLFFFFC